MRLLTLVQDRESATVATLCAELEASPATIHRDLAELAHEGLILRVRGGAMAVDPRDDPPASLEAQRNQAAKLSIATVAAELVRADSTVFLEASSTVRAMTPLIKRIPGLTVVTNGPEIGLDLLKGTVEVILIGGALRQRTRATVGPMAVSSLGSIRVETAFVGVSAISVDGVSSMNLSEAETKRAIMDVASSSVGLADSAKLGRRGLTQVSDLDRLDLLITDSEADEDSVAKLRERGLSVRIV